MCCILWGLVLNLSHTIIHPVQEWSGFQRHVWFWDGVRVHIIVINNKFVRVLCEQTGWLFINRSPRSNLHHFIRFPHLRRPILVSIPLWTGCSFYGLRGNWLSDLVFPRVSDAIEASTSGVLSLHRETKFIIGFDFAVTLSSPASSCVLFDITSEQSVELKWLMLNKHKRWFHSSRVDFPLVRMSASWFLVSMYLIWIMGSKLILSNNQSRATLWVRETCLIVGLLSFIINLITALLSSNTYNKASWREELMFEEIKSTLFRSSVIPWEFFRFWSRVSPFFITLICVSVKNCDDQIP